MPAPVRAFIASADSSTPRPVPARRAADVTLTEQEQQALAAQQREAAEASRKYEVSRCGRAGPVIAAQVWLQAQLQRARAQAKTSKTDKAVD